MALSISPEMKAITDTFGTVEAAVMTIQTGADLVIISHNEELQEQAFHALVAAVKSGTISEGRIDESLARVIKAKERFNLMGDLSSYERERSWRARPFEPVDLKVVGSAEHVRVMREAIRKSIIVVQDDPLERNLPLGTERILVIEFQTDAYNKAEDVLLNMGTLANALRAN